jgi:hypothetical protein
MGEITLIDAVTSQQSITEAERNLGAKLPQALTTFRLLVERSLRVVPDPSKQDLAAHGAIADPKDLPILGAAVRERCQWLVTFNVDDFEPGHPDVTVLRPGAFVQRVRSVLTHLDLTREQIHAPLSGPETTRPRIPDHPAGVGHTIDRRTPPRLD